MINDHELDPNRPNQLPCMTEEDYSAVYKSFGIAMYAVHVASCLYDIFNNSQKWRTEETYEAAKDKALLFMAHNPHSVVVVSDMLTGRAMFTNAIEVKQSNRLFV